ncbi:hypothetical protein [Ruegeria sp. EL01]|jgi:hypothetical protein|uniref:hypothetical protein n=1 Tax=Ruegeria sp. EL01 TaxID=2107578 RepID=UPI000EA80399|nr:hypothetical protein [Ruegeria sp. EL01]
MSDGVVKAGIEDVLSSVKRLVSDDGRKKSVSDQGSGGRKPGRLVLTDALRIGKPAKVEEGAGPLKLDPEYSAEESAKPMLLRACDIVRTEAAANQVEETQDAKAANAADTPQHADSSNDPTSSLSAKIEALEAAIARTEDQWEPDGDSDDAYSGTPTHALRWNVEEVNTQTDQEDLAKLDGTESEEVDEDSAQTAKFVRDPEVLASPPSEEDPADTIDQAVATMDEEELRRLIAEVVRQELQGALGERITRNVRKMVRREIARALAALEVD